MKIFNLRYATFLILGAACGSLRAMEQQEGGIYLTEIRSEAAAPKITISRKLASGDGLPPKEYIVQRAEDYSVKPFLLLNAPVQCQGTLGQCLGGAKALLDYVPEMPSGVTGWFAAKAATYAQAGHFGETAQRAVVTAAPVAQTAQVIKKASAQPLSAIEAYNSVPALIAQVQVGERTTDIELVNFAPGFYTLVVSANGDAHLEKTKAKGIWSLFGCCTRRK